MLIVMLMMSLMGLIGFAALESVTRDQRVAGYQKRQKMAFYAAEAGVAQAMEKLKTSSSPEFDPSFDGDSGLFPHGVPTYALDPSSGASTKNLGTGAFPGMNLAIGQNGLPKFTLRYWRVNVKGEVAGGSEQKIEFVSGTFEAN